MEVWRVNARHHSLERQPVPAAWERTGGRGLLARIMVEEVDATCDPLGPHNKLIFAPGLLVGHMLSSCDRISIGGKSPLTGGIKESNAGGRTGLQLTNLGIKALIVEDQPVEPGLWVLHLSTEGARWERADELASLGVFDTAASLIERYGKKVAIALIGPAAEMRMYAAGIQNLDKDRVPSRIAARGGMGAVMASKGLKAIVIDGSQGQKPPLVDPVGFKLAQKAYNEALASVPQTANYTNYGTAIMTMVVNTRGALPTRNFSAGQFEEAERISGEYMRESQLHRGGECDTSHACMAGCTIRSSNVYGDPDGKAIVSPLEYETIGLMGSNLGIGDLDTIARLNREVNDMGLDSIEIGAALGVAAEAGLMPFGDGARALELVKEIRHGTALGRVLGNGAAVTGQVYGVERVPVAKRQALSAYDPRAIKGTGVTYATSPQGGDHTAGLTIAAKVDHLSPEGQVEASLEAQVKIAGIDALGACIFARFGFFADPQVIPALLNARYDWNVDPDVLLELGKETLRYEVEFNRRAGFTSADDRLPEWMTREPLPPFNKVFDVPAAEMDTIFGSL